MHQIKVGRAWIVTYQSFTRYKHLNNKIISVLKWQKSLNQIIEHVTQLYVDNWLSPYEKVVFLKERDFEGLIYKPIISRKYKQVTIGHDPKLEARQVKNLKATENGNRGKWSYEEI